MGWRDWPEVGNMVLSRLMAALGPIGDVQNESNPVKELPQSPIKGLKGYDMVRVCFRLKADAREKP